MLVTGHSLTKKEGKGFFLALFFLFSLSVFSTLPSSVRAEELVPTIHSTESGGSWSSSSTWEEGRVPNEDDVVEVKGEVIMSGEHTVHGMVMRSGSKISRSSWGTATLTVNGDYLQEANSENDIITEVFGDVVNAGEKMSDLFVRGESHIQNSGNIHSLIFDTEHPVTLENTGSIEYVELQHDLTINTGFTTQSLRMNTSSIFLTEGSEDDQFSIGEISGNARDHFNEIDGRVILTANHKTLDVKRLQVKSISIPENYSISTWCEVEIDGNLILREGSTLSIGGYYCAKRLILDGNLTLEQETHIHSYYGNLEVKGELVNNGEIVANVGAKGGIENNGDIYFRQSGSGNLDKRIGIEENETQQPIHISGLEDYKVVLNGNVRVGSPQQLTLKELDPFYPSSLLFTHPDNATLILKNGIRYGSEFTTNVPIRVTEGGKLDEEIHAPRITVENGLSFFHTNAHIHAPFIVEHGSVSGDGGPEGSYTYFHDDVILKEGTRFLLSLYSDAAYFYKNIESHTNNQRPPCYSCHNPISHLTNEHENDVPYTFEIQYHGQILSLPANDSSITSFHYIGENGEEKFKEIRDIIFNPQDHLRWRSKSANSDWSPWYTINEKLYI